jgi:hypothetical protein
MDISESWEQEREQLNQRIVAVRQQGLCYSCHDLATGSIFGNQAVIYDDELFRFLIILSITFPMRDDQLYSSLLRLLTGILPSVCTC